MNYSLHMMNKRFKMYKYKDMDTFNEALSEARQIYLDEDDMMDEEEQEFSSSSDDDEIMDQNKW